MRATYRAMTVAAIALSACTSAIQKADDKVDFLERQHASWGDVCDAAREAAKSYADAQNDQYKTKSAIADIDCITAEQKGRSTPYTS